MSGFPAFVDPLKQDSTIKYRVRVGPELLRSDAQELRDRLNKVLKTENIKGLVLRYP